MQSSLVLGRAAGFSSIASPCRPCAPTSRSSLLVTNAYGDLPKIGRFSMGVPQFGWAMQARRSGADTDRLLNGGLSIQPLLQDCCPASGSDWEMMARGKYERVTVEAVPLVFPTSSLGGGRKWKYLKANKNGKVEAQKLHVKKGDFVQVRGNPFLCCPARWWQQIDREGHERVGGGIAGGMEHIVFARALGVSKLASSTVGERGSEVTTKHSGRLDGPPESTEEHKRRLD
eukprot:755468-Pelagomonas_calceolata.AAC.4